ncbi:alternative thymidylate synthase-like protein [Sulfobacillus acidophilus TPY]|uniref:Alternative thymidylate synthase n=1 Tax=Sulfobacillus acidophilus (strain ATCC 700253 / DSM 10332 / NAL) TaxID=679936 RepID=G8TUU6_SULAD|nr:alternative thymidylate synthase-like protein [Sulfobacillus acidophilus TPY]AEW05820.1 alternative thymidylate synthase [Sulfobacillus acidophilus DSM 10332]
MPNIYAVTHVPPEVSAYGMAKYSRSEASLRDSLLQLSQEKAEAFLRTFYFSYGHASIADLAHIALAIEEVSLLAAMEIVDEPLWDGQERSTRYQDFNDSPYYVPEGATPAYHQAVETLYRLYRTLNETAYDALTARYPMPQNIERSAYRRTLKARAFDIARYALPLATLTSLGQITSARVLEQQIRRLLASPYHEVRTIAAEMKKAASQAEPFNLLRAHLERRPDVPPAVLATVETGPVAPTLTKYTDPDNFGIKTRQLVQHWITEWFPGSRDSAASVTLDAWGIDVDPLDDLLAGLIYPYAAWPYRAIVDILRDIPQPLKSEWIDDVFRQRGAHDEWPRVLRQRPLIFDVVLDLGAFRDLNRHRRLDKVVQRLVPELGFETPEIFDDLGLAKTYRDTLAAVAATSLSPAEAPYILPLAHRRRMLLRMDFNELAYIAELRSRSSGHFSYRAVAHALYDAVSARFPNLARHIRMTPLETFDPFER